MRLTEALYRRRVPALARLSDAVRTAAPRLPAAWRRQQVEFVLSCRVGEAGGFRGRQGAADLYYTAFGARTLDLLGVDDPDTWCGLATFGAQQGAVAATPADMLSALDIVRLAAPRVGAPLRWLTAVAGWPRAYRRRLAAYRLDGPGYRRVPGGPASTYGTFLAVLALAALGDRQPVPADLAAMLAGRQRADGGFAESADAPASGVNPTAAALTVLGDWSTLAPPQSAAAARFLGSMQDASGGLRAHAQAPAADLLSTFTGLSALWLSGGQGALRLGDAARFARAAARPAGGFGGAPADAVADVEYTYYGVGVLALLTASLTPDLRPPTG